MSKSQWHCLLENLGEWQGSFTRLSPSGEILDDTPTLVTLAGLNENQTIRQLVRRFRPEADGGVTDQVLEYSSLGQGIRLFDNGAFSQGSMQLGPFSEFGAELGLIAGDRRLRLVQLFKPQGQLDRLTLIREQRVGTTAPERPPLTVSDLVGTWQGESVTIYPDWRSPDHLSSTLDIRQIEANRIVQTLSLAQQTMTSEAQIEGARLLFQQGQQSVQVLLLPDGGSSTCPQQLQLGKPFFLEMGWLLRPDLRQRLIRRYDDRGGWVSLTLVTEQKQGG
jgi:hypothetical protein